MPETIEAEIIEIDGMVPPKGAEIDSGTGSGTEPGGGSVRATLLNLDRRWWPLWLVLGALAVLLLLTVGVLVGFCALVLSLIRSAFRILIGASPRGSAGRAR